MAQLRNTLTIGPLRVRANPSATDAREELLAVKIYAATALAQRLSKSCQLRTLPTKPATTQNAAPSWIPLSSQ